MRKFYACTAVFAALLLPLGANAYERIDVPAVVSADLSSACVSNTATAGTSDQVVDLILLIDQSKSLTEEIGDSNTTKIEMLGDSLNNARPLFERANDRLRVGVVTFARDAQVVRSLGEEPFSPTTFDEFITEVTTEETLIGGTNYKAALETAIAHFTQNSPAENCRVLLWFTDGEVDLPGAEGEENGKRILDDFCGNEPGMPNKAQQLKTLGIVTYVVLLVKDPFKVEGSFKGDDYNKQASIIALRGVTGDWSEPGEPSMGPTMPCEDEENRDQGEVIQVGEVDGLVRQILEFVIKGTMEAEFCPSAKSTLESLPSGKFFDLLVIYIEGTQELVEPAALAGREFPIVLDRSDPNDSATLDQLENGWGIRGAGPTSYLCMGYKMRTDITFKAAPEKSQIRVDPTTQSSESESINATVNDLDGLARTDFTSVSSRSERLSVAQGSFSSGEINLGVRANKQDRKIQNFLNALELEVDLSADGRKILDDNPLLVSLELTRPIDVVGNEDVPKLECDEIDPDTGEFVLRISSRGEDVSKDPYSSAASCRFSNTGREDGLLRVRFGKPGLDPVSGVDFSILGNELLQKDLWEIANSTEVSNMSFKVGTSGALPNETINYLAISTLDVEFDNGTEPYSIGQIRVVVELSLLPRSNPVWAIVVALVVAVTAIALAYSFLYFILRRTASLGSQGSISAHTIECHFAIDSDGSRSIRWLEKETADLDPKVFENLRLADGSKASTESLDLLARVASPWRPQDVIRQAWVEVRSRNSRVSVISATPTSWYAYGSKDSDRCSMKAPLVPGVVLELLSSPKDPLLREANVTFLVRNQGEKFIDQTNRLKGLVIETARRAIEKEKAAHVRPASRIREVVDTGNTESHFEESRRDRPPR
jgi:hypothetical protein